MFAQYFQVNYKLKFAKEADIIYKLLLCFQHFLVLYLKFFLNFQKRKDEAGKELEEQNKKIPKRKKLRYKEKIVFSAS